MVREKVITYLDDSDRVVQKDSAVRAIVQVYEDGSLLYEDFVVLRK
jgi:hypothetical protein|tara:strand:+ start:2744 stop:2881 length:138 start_codon:yes stop_codon:yes gene_type:complete